MGTGPRVEAGSGSGWFGVAVPHGHMDTALELQGIGWRLKETRESVVERTALHQIWPQVVGWCRLTTPTAA